MTHLGVNIVGVKTYRVTSNGPDGAVTVIVRDDKNDEVTRVELKKASHVDVVVPDGGDLQVLDAPDPGADDNGASGAYGVV